MEGVKIETERIIKTEEFAELYAHNTSGVTLRPSKPAMRAQKEARSSFIMGELKEEDDDQEELKPLVQVFLDPKEVSSRKVEPEDEDPLAMCNENFEEKSSCSFGGECGVGVTCESPPVGKAEANCDENELTLTNAQENSNALQCSLCQKYYS